MDVPQVPTPIGTGKMGGKSQSLIDAKGAFQKAGLPFPKLQPCTSEHFEEFYDRAGANGKGSNAEKQKKVMETKFTYNEMKPIIEAALRDCTYAPLFPDEKPFYAAFARSDEYEAGTGVRKSQSALSHGSEALFIDRLFFAIKEVLASRFNEDAVIFDRMMGLGKEANGAMIMPYYGSHVIGNSFTASFPILLSVAYGGDSKKAVISTFESGSLVQWHNIGGVATDSMFNAILANNFSEHLTPKILHSKINFMNGACSDSTISSSFGAIIKASLPPGISDGYSERIVNINIDDQLHSLCASVNSVSEALPLLFSELGPFYAEFVMNPHASGAMPVQLAKLRTAAFKVDLSARHLPIQVIESIGTCERHVEKVRSAGRVPSEDDIRFNEGNSGYMLHIKANGRLPMESWSLRHLFNAGAVFLEVPGASNYNFGFHLGGYLRELGIPLIISNTSPIFRQDGKYIVYADEFLLNGLTYGAIFEA
ncbi:MAG: hypothetical protein WCY41_05370 [Candidatus Micrarchaeia archaeon]